MSYTKQQLLKDLHTLGVREGDTVLMHSSYKSLGEIEGGAKIFFEAFLEVLGSTGTLVLPTLSYESVTRVNPVFDRALSPSCVGYLSEYFRTSVAGVIRSLHPTHSCCAVGRLAEELTREHELDMTPVGAHSPFAKLPLIGGKILMLGCNPARNTSLHGVEETVEGLPYGINRDVPVHYVLHDGETTIHQEVAYRHDFHPVGVGNIEQRYDRIIDLLDESEISHRRVLDADCYLMDARALWKKGREAMLKDAYHFVNHPADPKNQK